LVQIPFKLRPVLLPANPLFRQNHEVLENDKDNQIGEEDKIDRHQADVRSLPFCRKNLGNFRENGPFNSYQSRLTLTLAKGASSILTSSLEPS